MEITKDIIYVGVNDHDVDLFEGHYIVRKAWLTIHTSSMTRRLQSWIL